MPEWPFLSILHQLQGSGIAPLFPLLVSYLEHAERCQEQGFSEVFLSVVRTWRHTNKRVTWESLSMSFPAFWLKIHF